MTASDLSSIQPKDVASNIEFIREDADDEWTYNHKFAYIHARFFCSFVTDFKGIVKKAYDHLEPGGLIELHELAMYADTFWGGDDESALCEISTSMVQIMSGSSRDPFAVYKLTAMREEAGFVEVQEKVQPWPADRRLARRTKVQKPT